MVGSAAFFRRSVEPSIFTPPSLGLWLPDGGKDEMVDVAAEEEEEEEEEEEVEEGIDPEEPEEDEEVAKSLMFETLCVEQKEKCSRDW